VNRELQDQMHSPWPSATIARVLRERHEVLPHVLITFDERGVSGHPNHISCLRGAQEWVLGLSETAGVELWMLGTVGIVRKYLFVLDGVVQAVLGGRGAGAGWFVSSVGEVRVAREAMVSAHKSQMRWFRWGWIGLSRYMVVNGLERG
jgi:N-acetylglucosaminylphosphatidylinositol deacetylase